MDFKPFIEKLSDNLKTLPVPLTITLKVIGIIIISILIAKLGSFIIRKAFLKKKIIRFGIDNKKIKTMVTLLISVYKYTVYIVAFVFILTDVFEFKSILATAGIGGIAVGLGAQSLIKDIIAGFFIIMEDQYVSGDLISIDNMKGNVEEIDLRVTRLRNINGDLHIIPNGDIKRVTNHTRGNKAIIVDIPVSHGTDIDKVFKIIEKVCEKVKGEFNTITEEPKLVGITEIDKVMVNIRVMGKALVNEQEAVERRIRFLIKEEFDKAELMF